ncbi:hydantoinase/oxoprolinase family protein [Acuticoccus kandeliae]|uniref:hydantoinase/oxoprolinase family protein n=1 Tax=Acuticoccus kandeliae TaxID=2073160 RepID=UPI00196B8424|nr:hydantoinase/oxoprolinase family protein [Acuticoccus kandeliae]
MVTAKIGVDVGGTFTDTFMEMSDGRTLFDKRLTTGARPEDAILGALDSLVAQAGLGPGDVTAIVHGTTLATNAVIERRGARTGLVTTEGFRDVLEMGREDRYAQYDLNMEKPAPLVPRRRRLTVPERIAADGRVLVPLDRAALAATAARLMADAVDSVAIAFMNSYVNPEHEAEAADILAALMPGVALTLSCDVAPVMREYERFTTAAANAYVKPLIARYLARLGDALDARGYACPRLLMLSSGTLCDFATGERYPVRLIESGPAGGAIFAARLAARHSVPAALAFDLGGTTAKMTLIDNGAPHLTSSLEVARMAKFVRGSGLPLKIPSVDLLEIGAGGGSVAWRDTLGRLRVGPEGTGSDPGPACYAQGGTEPTVTDANLLLGRVTPETFAGGQVPLCREKAAAAIARLDGAEMADGPAAILAAVDEAMALAARLHAVENGANPAQRVLIAFGGGGPLHAASLAEAIGISTVLVPPDAGVGSAVGLLAADFAFEVTRTHPHVLGGGDTKPALATLRERMECETRALLAPSMAGDAPTIGWRATMRYRGQGHELEVPIPAPTAAAADLRDAFEAAYARLYGRTLDAIDVEVVSWTCRVGSTTAPPPEPATPAQRRPADEKADGRLTVGGARHPVIPHAIFARRRLSPGDTVGGPCLVREDATTTAVPPGWSMTVASDGTLHLTRDVPPHAD